MPSGQWIYQTAFFVNLNGSVPVMFRGSDVWSESAKGGWFMGGGGWITRFKFVLNGGGLKLVQWAETKRSNRTRCRRSVVWPKSAWTRQSTDNGTEQELQLIGPKS